MSEELNRAVVMLRVAMNYIRDNCDDEVIFYDDAECDGACLADDCEIAADMLEVRIGAINSDALELIEAKARITELEGFLEEVIGRNPEVHRTWVRDPQDEVPDMIEHDELLVLQEDARELLKVGK